MRRLSDAFEDHDYFFVTHDSEATKNLKNGYRIKFDGWNLVGKIMLTKVFIKAIYILLKQRPDAIVSTGAGEIAVPFCYIGKLLGMKIIFIDTLARLTTPSSGGRLIYPIADLFLVQWIPMLKIYGKNAKYWGKLI
jgi:UDP-N-acetylglucosamine:LPS N-acetylglucosamine transferase